MASQRRIEEYGFWKSLPIGSLLLFFSAVFCLFASFAFITDVANPGVNSRSDMALSVFLSGFTAIVFAFLGTRRKFKALIVLAILEFAVVPFVFGLVNRNHAPHVVQPRVLSPAAVHHQLAVDAAAIGVLVIAGYILMLYFVTFEGRRYFRVHSEMRLAGDIHRALVPEISRRIGKFDFYGASVPSGAVGGDLLDVLDHGQGAFSYVADVSGHGVPAGVLMAMVKSAARMRLADQSRTGTFLDDLNAVLHPLGRPDTFVTFAYLCSNGDSAMEFSLAGHPPILHFRASPGEVIEHSVSNLPLGIFPEHQFESSSLSVASGDLLVILTDGLPETFDAQQRELGMEALKRMIQEVRARPLKEIFDHVRAKTLAFGKQLDDQTLLLVRRLPG